MRLRDHRLLRVTESASENIHSADVIGIVAVVALNALEYLSSPVFPSNRPTAWACPGGVSGIHSYKTNTVLLSQHRNPCHDLPVCPRCYRFTEIFRTIFLLAFFKILKTFNPKSPYRSPREPFKDSINIILSDRKSTRLNSSHSGESRMPSSA